jgi:hypothetical protein
MDQDSIEHRVGAARKSNPGITEAVATRIKLLLSSDMSQEHLTEKELRQISISLIADMLNPASVEEKP